MRDLPDNFEELPSSLQDELIELDADAEMNRRVDEHHDRMMGLDEEPYMSEAETLDLMLNTSVEGEEPYSIFDSGCGPHGQPDSWHARDVDGRTIISSDLGGAETGAIKWYIGSKETFTLIAQIGNGNIRTPEALEGFCKDNCIRKEVIR